MGQEPRTDCKEMTYASRNPTDAAPLEISRIKGIAQDAGQEEPDPDWQPM